MRFDTRQGVWYARKSYHFPHLSKGLLMLLIDNRSQTDPAMNLALEDYLVRRFHGGETVL